MGKPGTLLAVDGNSVAHRAYHGYERMGLAAPDGRPIFAVYGFMVLLVGILDRVGPDALVVGFDDRSRSVRRDVYPEYKAGRAERSPDLYAQMDEIADVLRALGVVVVTPDGLEADDVLGSAAAAAEGAGWRCVVATSDKDAFALISEQTTVLRLVSKLENAVRMTPQVLHEDFGVRPGQYLDYVALCGDKSDALRGVMGIGEKTAVKLLAAVGNADAAVDKANREAVAAAVGKAAAAKLHTDEARAVIDRNRSLMAIRRDVPVDLAGCRLAVTSGRVTDVLRERHLPMLIRRTAAALCRPELPAGLPQQPSTAPAAAPPSGRPDPAVEYPYECPIPGCGRPARLYPAGPRCDVHVPSTPKPFHPGLVRSGASSSEGSAR